MYIYLLSHMIDLNELRQPVAVDHVVQNVHNNLHNEWGGSSGYCMEAVYTTHAG